MPRTGCFASLMIPVEEFVEEARLGRRHLRLLLDQSVKEALRAARVPCAFVSSNPKRARGNTSNSVLDYDHYMTATTVDEFFSRKGNWGHLKYDVQFGAASSRSSAASTAWRLMRVSYAIAASRRRRRACHTQAGLLHARRGEIR